MATMMEPAIESAISLEQETQRNLFRTSQCLVDDFARLFKQHGLSSPQYQVLRILRQAGPDGLPSLEIGSRMLTRVPDVTRLIDRLEDAELVTRHRTKADRRVVLVRLSERGLELLDSLDGPVQELYHEQFSHLSGVELDELNRLLSKVRDGRHCLAHL